MRGIILPCNMLANNFVMILIAQLRREIGLKSLTVAGLFVLGIRVMWELFIDCRSKEPLKKSKHRL